VLRTVEVRFGSDELPTREGAFAVFRKSRDHVSSLYDTSMPFAMFFSGGQAVHYSPDFAANGYNGASHGCVNVRDRAAVEWLFDHVVIGDEVFVVTAGALVSYDASDDAWAKHPALSAELEYGQLVAYGDRVIVVPGERHRNDPPDQVYDPATQSWSTLPTDPLGPAFDRVITATAAGLVLTGQDLVLQPSSEGPSFVRAALLEPTSGRWTLLADSDQLGGWRWTWTGSRMVDPTPGGADGGEVNGFGRMIRYGGVLDPAAVDGWVYDDRDETWTELPRPDGAPQEAGSAVWADGQLIVLGGVDFEDGYTVEALSDGAWSYDA